MRSASHRRCQRRLARRRFLEAAGALYFARRADGRVEAAGRPQQKAPYRILYSNDTTNITTCESPYHKRGQPFRIQMIEASVDETAGRGIDAHLLQPGFGWVPWWRSQVYPADKHYRWWLREYGGEPDGFARYMLDGGDMVAVFVERCKSRGLAPFEVFADIADAVRVAALPQHYFLSPGSPAPRLWRPQLPRRLTPGRTEEFRLDAAPPTGGWKSTGRLRVQAARSFGRARLSASLNEVALEPVGVLLCDQPTATAEQRVRGTTLWRIRVLAHMPPQIPCPE